MPDGRRKPEVIADHDTDPISEGECHQIINTVGVNRKWLLHQNVNTGSYQICRVFDMHVRRAAYDRKLGSELQCILHTVEGPVHFRTSLRIFLSRPSQGSQVHIRQQLPDDTGMPSANASQSHYQHTGDQELVRELSPFVNKLLDQFKSYRGTSGLLSNAPDYMFMDFREIAGINCHHPPAVIGMGYMTALFCRALEDGRRVAQLVGDSQRAEHYARLHREMSAAFEKELWNPEKGLYRDGKPFISSVKPSKWLPEDTQIETFSPHVNIMSILYGLAPSERRAGIFKTLLSTQKELNVSAYFGYFTLPAMDRAGLFAELGLPQMLKWPIRPESKTVSEHGHGGTLSHGWISAPLINLSQRVLGITPAEPGYVKADIRPQLCGLSWAKGAVPLPKGKVIKVEWRQKDRYFELQADSPVPATITLPFSSAEVLRATVNGRPLEIKSNPVQFDAKPGNLTVVVEIKQP
jgi:hypothetical protein